MQRHGLMADHSAGTAASASGSGSSQADTHLAALHTTPESTGGSAASSYRPRSPPPSAASAATAHSARAPGGVGAPSPHTDALASLLAHDHAASDSRSAHAIAAAISAPPGAHDGSSAAAWIWGLDSPNPGGAAEWATHFDDFSGARSGVPQMPPPLCDTPTHVHSAVHNGIANHADSAAAAAAAAAAAHGQHPVFAHGSYPDFDTLWQQAAQDGTLLPHSSDASYHAPAQPIAPSADQTHAHSFFGGKRKEREESHESLRRSISASGDDDDDASDDDMEDGEDGGADGQSSDGRAKVQRRQGVTCDACRAKHLRCDLLERRVSSGLPPSPDGRSAEGVKCSRCTEKGLTCGKSHAPPSRRYPRPSRTGKRIEQARMLHGSMPGDADGEALLSLAQPQVASSDRGDARLASRVMAGSISLRLLTCFFATAHIQLPIVDFAHFSSRYNFARGNPRIMSIMSNGGKRDEGIPSAPLAAPGLRMRTWAPSNESTLATPGTSQVLIAVMHAWAAHYTDMPIAFGQHAAALGFREGDGQESSAAGVLGGAFGQRQESDDKTLPRVALDPKSGSGETPWASAAWPADSLASSSADGSLGTQSSSAPVAGGRRPKRKQGVACDTCRLRRVRCDVTERAAGLGCSRCEDKRIVCTQEYINTKRKDNNLPPVAPVIPGQVPRELAATATQLAEEVGVDAWKDRGKENSDWINGGPRITEQYTAGRAKELLRWGRARRAFCHEMLAKAVSLVHKHDLLRKPSVEGIQCLLILCQILDRIDPASTPLFAETAARHVITLGLEQPQEVHEQDQAAVEGLINKMQHGRVYTVSWTYASLISLLGRTRPPYEADRAIGIQAGAGKQKSGRSAQNATSPAGGVQLSGEMGLSFSLLAKVQLGALARFLSNHIDNPMPVGMSTTLVSAQDRFGKRPTTLEMQRLEKACSSLWRSIDSLLLFFDRCIEAARAAMNNLTAFQHLPWIATIKVSACMLDLAVYRVLGERFQVQAAHLAALHAAFPGSAETSEDAAHAATLSRLLQRSRERTLLSCRSLALVCEVLLPRRVFHTGGTILGQLSAVAQFLIRTPYVVTMPPAPPSPAQDQAWGELDDMATPFAPSDHVDPRTFLSPAALAGLCALPSVGSPSPSALGRSPQHTAAPLPNTSGHKQGDAAPHVSVSSVDHLGTYDLAAKQREVGVVLEGIAQLGYAFDIGAQLETLEALFAQKLHEQQQQEAQQRQQQQHSHHGHDRQPF